MSVKLERGRSHGKHSLGRSVEAAGRHLHHLSEKSLSDGCRRSNSVDGCKTKQRVVILRMTPKMKGLLKGLRYFSHMFESSGKLEHEMQIGYPTDVKHVAHIGWEDSSMNPPSWMKEYSAPLTMVGDEVDDVVLPSLTRRNSRAASTGDSPASDSLEIRRPRRRQPTITANSSPLADISRQSSCDSKLNTELDGSIRRSRRHHKSGRLSNGSKSSPTHRSGRLSNGGKSSPTHNPARSGKELNRRRRSKGSSEGGSSSCSRRRSKAIAANYSDPGVTENGDLVCKALQPTMEQVKSY